MSRAIRHVLTALGARARRVFAAAIVAMLPLLAAAQGPGPDFDHLTTGFPLTGAHKSARCETCHVKGIFKGTPKTCEACHAPGGRLSSVIMPTTHAPTTQRCELCHTTVTFIGARWNHTGAQPGACATCHNGTTAPGKPSGHVQTTQSCDACHRTSAWTPASFDHAGIVNGCATCHNGASAIGKSATHIPTSQSCETCHTSTTAFSVRTMNHAQIASGCAQCHGGQFPDVTAKPSNHVQTSAPCETCHTNVTSFKGATFTHAGIAGQCASCHDGSTALGRPTGHVPTNQPCEVCHSATSFTTFGGTQMNHAGIASGCSTCHAAGASFLGVAMKTPPATHIPFGGASCESCHTASNFTSFSGTPMNHAAVAGVSCATCHETGRSWFGVTIVTRPTPGQDPNHPTTGDCGSCHSTATFAGAVGKPANHLPTNQPCTLCHSNPSDYSVGTMNHAGISSGCATCHAPGASFANIVPRTPPATHIPSGGASCESCHTASNFTSFSGTPMNHTAVAGVSCATCHETGKSWFGVTIVTRPTPSQDPNHPTTGDCVACHSTATFAGAVGKPANHLPTNQPCALCHSNPNDYGVGTMNHAGITSGCATCHAPGASFANIVPKTPPATHFPTPMPCETCHAAGNFTSFAGTTMNHAGVTANCATCHASGRVFFGVTMKTPPANHVPTGAPCEICHAASNFASFGGASMSHAGITSGCSSCHAAGSSFFGVTMRTPPATHIPFGGASCESCHAASNFTSFSGTPMNHTAVAGVSCATCHETGRSWFGVTIVTRPTPGQDPNHPTTGDCGSCHSTATFAGAVGKPANHLPTNQPCALCHSNPNDYSVGTMNHAGISSGCATCHAPGASFANIVPKTPPATHFPTPMPCETCHAAGNFTSFAGTTMNHSGITANCANCHAAGKSFFGVTMKTPPATHIPFGGATCESCHAASNFASFSGTPMNHTAVAGVTCATCHETGKSFFGVTIVTRPTPSQDPNHPTTGDCGSCHTTATFNGATGKPANHLPTNQPCTLCHSNPNDYSVGTMNHSGITSGCSTCHAAGSSFANIVPKTPPANHIPTSKPCETCHAASNFTSFAGTSMNHAGITSGCSSCHAAGSSFFGVTMKTPPATHIPFGGASCESCHAASNFTSFSGTSMNHTPVAGITCATCHETGKSFFGVTIVTRPTLAQDPNHPQTGDCGSCHTTATFGGAVGKPANHLPTNQPCSLCHSNPNDFSVGTMNHSGITSGCATCHAPGSSFANIVPKTPPANHIPTSKPCETCHAASNFTSFAGTAMNHAGITSGCSTCHAAGKSFFGVTMKTPPGTHIPFGSAACEACHAPANFNTFSGTPMNHSAVAGMTCMSCHELGMSWFGVRIVTRPGAGHNPGQDCRGCHNTTSFDDGGGGGDAATRLNARRALATPADPAARGRTPRSASSANVHMGIAPGSCSSCHNGSMARAKPGRHIVTALSCDACHRTTAWMPASFTHQGSAPGTCMSCHNAALAKGKAASHFVTVRSCDACHRTTSWAGVRYQHVSPAYRPHGPNVSCAACHKTNSEAVVWRNAAFKPDCAGCHADRFPPQQHPKAGPGGGLHTIVEMRDCAGSCHLGAGPAKTPKTFASRHRPTDGSF